MKNVLTILLVLVLAVDAVLWYRMRKLILGWAKEVEDHDVELTDKEERYVEICAKLLPVLNSTALTLFLLRFVVYELLPLIRG